MISLAGIIHLLNTEASLKGAAVPAEFGANIPEVTVGGEPFYRLEVEIPLPVVRLYMSVYSRKTGKYVLSFVFTTVSKGEMDMLRQTLTSVEFMTPTHPAP